MSLARRTARQHETAASLRVTSGVRSEDYWDFKPGQPVMTREGFPGVVSSVQDGPFPGAEQYIVTLDHGLGGGEYGPGELRPMAATTASTEHTAADDYPELGTILVDRPDIALNTVLGSKTAEVTHEPVVDTDRLLPKACSHCGADGNLAFEASYEDTGRGFRATCSNCRGQMVTSGYGMWNPALPSAQNQPSSQPSQQFLGSLLTEAVGDPEFGFHFTASWSDVRAKATTIRSEGGVRITTANDGTIAGEVKGEHHIYETQIVNVPGRRTVATWSCACKWGAYAWGRSPAFKRFEGRMCSHALALHFEAQSRGMFGREISEDTQRPSWMRAHTPVVVHHDRDTGSDRTRRAVPPGNMKRTFSSLDVEGVYEDDSLDLAHPPVVAMFEEMVENDIDPADAMRAAAALGYDHEDSKTLLFMGIEAAKKKHKKKRHHNKPARYTHHECNGGGCRGCGGWGWGAGGWWGPYGGGVGNPQNADGVSTGGDSGGSVGDGGGGGGSEASLQTTAGPMSVRCADCSTAYTAQAEHGAPRCPSCGSRSSAQEGMKQHRNDATENYWHDLPKSRQRSAAAHDPLQQFDDTAHRSDIPDPGNLENPASAGFATGQDAWPHFNLDTRVDPIGTYASLDESMFEPGDGFGVEAIQHDEPEPALPTTEADEDDPDCPSCEGTGRNTSYGSADRTCGECNGSGEQRTASLTEAQTTEDIVAAFQATAKHLDGPSASQDSSDIAQAARDALSKMALKDFSAAEQQALINEGTDVRAANLDRLDVTGTHYEAVLAAVAAEEAADDEWLA